MKQIDGLWWPDFDVRCRAVVVSECAAAMPAVLPLVAEKRVCVQAGGNVGVYPLALSKVFDRVITFEPDRDNLDCLIENVRDVAIEVRWGALGAEPGTCGILRIDTDNCGSHKTLPGDAIPVRTIDSLISKERILAQQYTERLLDFLGNNSIDFPEYNSNGAGDVFPDSNNNNIGWFI